MRSIQTQELSAISGGTSPSRPGDEFDSDGNSTGNTNSQHTVATGSNTSKDPTGKGRGAYLANN
jgi:hypothetical protein